MFLTQFDKIDSPSGTSPLSLAYIGDAVYELYVRNMVMCENNVRAGKLHREGVRFVNAGAQAELYRSVEHMLSEEEITIFKRGRNAKSGTVPKNADLLEYKVATGLEALIGHLYLSGNIQRIAEILKVGFANIKGGK